MTVGSVIFLFVALALQIEVIFAELYRYGPIDLIVKYNSAQYYKDEVYMFASDLDPVLREYSPYIEDWGYITRNFAKTTYVNLPPTHDSV